MAGEPGICDKLTEDYNNPKVSMALNMVKEGYVAVAVDNAAAGEASDLECYDKGWNYDYDVVSRFLLELGWSWLGYTSYLDMQVLNWMKDQSYIRKDRIVISGFSLGTEPMMVLGVLDKDIYAFVYNDFLCQTQERAVVMTKPDKENRRPFPNSIRHLIPGYWRYFNFPDVVASLAPRPIILQREGWTVISVWCNLLMLLVENRKMRSFIIIRSLLIRQLEKMWSTLMKDWIQRPISKRSM